RPVRLDVCTASREAFSGNSSMDTGSHRVLNIAIVAPTIGILGGQAVQADRLLSAWAGDPEVRAWLVPVNPSPPWPVTALTRVKYLRTVATQLTYWPLLIRELR